MAKSQKELKSQAKRTMWLDDADHFNQKIKARRGVEKYEKAKKASAKKADRARTPSRKEIGVKLKPAAKKEPANWATRLKAKLEFAKRAQKKAYKRLSAAEKREKAKNAMLRTGRTKDIEGVKDISAGIKSDVQKREERKKRGMRERNK